MRQEVCMSGLDYVCIEPDMDRLYDKRQQGQKQNEPNQDDSKTVLAAYPFVVELTTTHRPPIIQRP